MKGDRGRPLTQEELTARLEFEYGVSMSPGHLSKIEQQKALVVDKQLYAFAKALGVQICDLFPEESENGSKEG